MFDIHYYIRYSTCVLIVLCALSFSEAEKVYQAWGGDESEFDERLLFLALTDANGHVFIYIPKYEAVIAHEVFSSLHTRACRL
jgi:hypothetical protein